jgi:carboxyl-terminal processing protease
MLRKTPLQRPRTRPGALLAAAALLLAANAHAPAQTFGGKDIERGGYMLKTVKKAVKENYYDPSMRGLDIDAEFSAAEAHLKLAQSYGDIYEAIARVLLKLNDSHTAFIPPLSSTRVEYGWRMQMVGDKCFVVAVKEGSDAERKGLRPGDELVQVFGQRPTRENFWTLSYLNLFLKHFSEVGMVVRKVGGPTVRLQVAAEVRQERQVFDLGRMDSSDRFEMIRRAQTMRTLNPHVGADVGERVFVWKMKGFHLEDSKVDEMMAKARRRDTLVLDLRGNGGGLEATLLRLVGNVFERDVRVGDIKRRDEKKPLVAKTRGRDAFKGRLVVLTDSRTGSAAELFARVVQLERRGTVIGDRTSGAVMRAKLYQLRTGADMVVNYGVLVTDSDILMADGKSLEGAGVTPDELLLPSAEDLGAGRDTVLARAAALAGVELSAERAAELFPVDWRQYGFFDK